MKKANKKANDKVVDVTKVTPEVKERALKFHEIWKSGVRSIPKIAEMLGVKENTLRGQLDTIAAVVAEKYPEVKNRFYYIRKYKHRSAKGAKKKANTGQIKSDKKTTQAADAEDIKIKSAEPVNQESLDVLFDTVINGAEALVKSLGTFVENHSIAEPSEANKEELK